MYLYGTPYEPEVLLSVQKLFSDINLASIEHLGDLEELKETGLSIIIVCVQVKCFQQRWQPPGQARNGQVFPQKGHCRVS